MSKKATQENKREMTGRKKTRTKIRKKIGRSVCVCAFMWQHVCVSVVYSSRKRDGNILSLKRRVISPSSCCYDNPSCSTPKIIPISMRNSERGQIDERKLRENVFFGCVHDKNDKSTRIQCEGKTSPQEDTFGLSSTSV